MQRYFRYIRFFLQLVVFSLFFLTCIGFAGSLPIAKGAFIPAFISGTTIGMIIFWVIVIITCITGRAFYCSIFCPLGFLQDIVGLFRKKKPFINSIIFGLLVGCFGWLGIKCKCERYES